MKPPSQVYRLADNRRQEIMIISGSDETTHGGSPSGYLLRMCEAGNKKSLFWKYN